MDEISTCHALAEEGEGFVNVQGFKLYYRMVGDAKRGNIVCLHGGPGVPHQYLLPFAELAKDGYRVVFYDQLGVGKSSLPKNRALFTMERYVEDLEQLRKELRLGKMHIIGNSCGGQLAIAYALKYQRNLRSLTLVGALANVPLVLEEMTRLKLRLPPDVVDILEKYEALGEYEHPEYLKAVQLFYRKYLCRLKVWPKELSYSLENISKSVYGTMWGPNEFVCIGTLRYWNVTNSLSSIKVPTLVTCGKYDEVSPKEAKSIHDHIKGSELFIFTNSSHLAFWEQRKDFMQVQRRFLREVERRHTVVVRHSISTVN